MNKKLLLLLLMLCCLPMYSQKFKAYVVKSHSTPVGVALTWTYTPNAPACSGTNTNCYSGFTMTLTSVTPNIVLATPTTLGPTALAYTYTPSGGLPYGT